MEVTRCLKPMRLCAKPFRAHAACIGGTVLCSMSTFKKVHVAILSLSLSFFSLSLSLSLSLSVMVAKYFHEHRNWV